MVLKKGISQPVLLLQAAFLPPGGWVGERGKPNRQMRVPGDRSKEWPSTSHLEPVRMQTFVRDSNLCSMSIAYFIRTFLSSLLLSLFLNCYRPSCKINLARPCTFLLMHSFIPLALLPLLLNLSRDYFKVKMIQWAWYTYFIQSLKIAAL